MLGVANLTAVGLAGCRRQLVAPFVATVRLAAVGHVGSRHLRHSLQLVDNGAVLEQVQVAVLA